MRRSGNSSIVPVRYLRGCLYGTGARPSFREDLLSAHSSVYALVHTTKKLRRMAFGRCYKLLGQNVYVSGSVSYA